MLTCSLVPPAPKLEFAKRRRVERIRGEAIPVANRADLFEPPLGALVLCDRDGAPSNTGTYSNLAPVRCSISGITTCAK